MPCYSSRTQAALAVIVASAIFLGLGAAGQAASKFGEARISAGGSANDPIVIELFQSQGCSSCPPANAYLNSIADRPDILALSFAVTYWDQLGWKDTFGSPRFTQRQQDYARAGRGQVATPELIINGSHAVVGFDRRDLDRSIATIGPARVGPKISYDGTAVHLSAATARATATVWLVRYDPGSRNVPIRAGENGGRTLPHRNIVRELASLGSWSGAAASFQLPSAKERDLSTAILIQRGVGGQIIAARKL